MTREELLRQMDLEELLKPPPLVPEVVVRLKGKLARAAMANPSAVHVWVSQGVVVVKGLGEVEL
jgi:hypothetical protein